MGRRRLRSITRRGAKRRGVTCTSSRIRSLQNNVVEKFSATGELLGRVQMRRRPGAIGGVGVDGHGGVWVSDLGLLPEKSSGSTTRAEYAFRGDGRLGARMRRSARVCRRRGGDAFYVAISWRGARGMPGRAPWRRRRWSRRSTGVAGAATGAGRGRWTGIAVDLASGRHANGGRCAGRCLRG